MAHLKKTNLTDATDLDLTGLTASEYMKVDAGGLIVASVANIPYADISGAPASTDIYSADGTTGAGRAVGITDTLAFDTNLLYLDKTSGFVAIGSTSQNGSAKLGITGDSYFSGSIGVGASVVPSVKVYIKGTTAGSGTYALQVADSGGVISLGVRDDNLVIIGNGGGIPSKLAMGSSKGQIYQTSGGYLTIYSGNNGVNAGIAIGGSFNGSGGAANAPRTIQLASRAQGSGFPYLLGTDQSSIRTLTLSGMLKLTDIASGVKNMEINPLGAGVAPDDVLVNFNSTTQGVALPKVTTAQREQLHNGDARPTASASAASNTDPIVITTTAAHSYVTGDRVIISGVGGNTAANGSFYINVLTTTTFELFTDIGLTVSVAGNGAYTSGGNIILYYIHTEGVMVYNTDNKDVEFWDGLNWIGLK